MLMVAVTSALAGVLIWLLCHGKNVSTNMQAFLAALAGFLIGMIGSPPW